MEDEVNLGAEEQDPAGYGFEPTEDELVLHFLRPQLRGFAPRLAGAVVEADPCGAAPCELLARHGRRDRGYFFAARGRKKPFVRWSVAGGGAWMHSSTKNGRSVTDLGVVVRWYRLKFCFYVRGEMGQRSTGWVMDEYEITDPRCYRRADDGEEDEYWVLCHVRKSMRTVATTDSPGGRGASAQAKARRRELAA